MELKKIRVGGVPEHFNLPWHLAIERNLFEEKGLSVEWKTFKGGTGAMTKALRENEVDLCILLTEGIVKDIIKGNPSKILSVYVESPLVWGIHSGASNPLSDIGEIYDRKYAISRFGSGSHLMAQVDAFYNNSNIKEDQFEVVGNLDGALDSLKAQKTDVFYWEKFTTKPYVDNGLLKRIGEYPTPWPCFVIAGTEKIIKSNSEAIKELLNVINEMSTEFMKMPDAVSLISKRYKLEEKDVKEWFNSTQWNTTNIVDQEMIQKVIFTLQKANVLKEGETLPIEEMICVL